MKKTKTKNHEAPQADMLPEYELTGKKGVRGKYYRAYRQGHTVKILNDDGTARIQYFTLEDGAVMLEPDVRRYFTNSDAVNSALRSLIALIPAKPPKRKASANQSAGAASATTKSSPRR
jgi:hypothetical protein